MEETDLRGEYSVRLRRKLSFVQKDRHKKDEKVPIACEDAPGIQHEAQGILPLEVRECAVEARLGGLVGKMVAVSHAEEWAGQRARFRRER